MTLKERVAQRAHARRWLILGVLCFSLLVIVLDNTILNVAIPVIARDLDASNSQIQWIVDAYTLVFAGLLLTAGSIGDRVGRRPTLQVGFAVFGVGAAVAALVDSADQLVAVRAFMGIGAALIMPATLSIVTNLFHSRERGRAIAIWVATAGVGTALGPITAGVLLEHFYWGSIFLVNLPVVAVGVLAGIFLIPDSKDPAAGRLDPLGAVLSTAGMGILLYGVIEGPSSGWTSTGTLAPLIGGALLLLAFVIWESRCDHPMLDLSFFSNPRFTAACLSITVLFLAMFGTFFLVTQYLQLVLGLSALDTGVRLLAWAVPMMTMSLLSSRLVRRFGAKVVVTVGMVAAAVGPLSYTFLDVGSSDVAIVWRLALMASGAALVMAPATESIMGSLPLAKAGVGSAMNDATRLGGGAIGVAIVGSVFASVYGSRIDDHLAGRVSGAVLEGARRSLGSALEAVPDRLAGVVKAAYVDGFHAGAAVAGGLLLLGAVVVLAWLPARARAEDVDRQHTEYEAHHARLSGRADVPGDPDEDAPLVPEPTTKP